MFHSAVDVGISLSESEEHVANMSLLDPTLPIMQQLSIRLSLCGPNQRSSPLKCWAQSVKRCVVHTAAYLKLLGYLGSVQEQPGAETVHWTKVSCRGTKGNVLCYDLNPLESQRSNIYDMMMIYTLDSK